MSNRVFRISLVCTVMLAAAAGIVLSGLVGGRVAIPDRSALIEVGVRGASVVERSMEPLPSSLGEYRDPIAGRSLFDSSGGGGGGGGLPAARDLPARLLATSAAAETRYSSALIAVEGGDAQVYGIGDRVADAVIEGIDRRRVILRRGDGRRELLRLGGGARAGSPGPQPKQAKGASRIDWSQGVEDLGGNRYRVERATLEEALLHLDEVGKGVRVVPNFKDGELLGYRIVKIRGDSPLKLLGLERNDVIQGVDGGPVDPAAALDLLGKVEGLEGLALQLDRGGEPLELTYEIY